MSALIFLPILGALVWLMVVPQRRQLKQHRELLANLAAGDAVVTSSGIYGVITELDGEVVYLEVADGIELKLSKSAVARILPDADDTDDAGAAETGASEGK
jgi:preprotein translocase subunit YajC